tara:strand:+ start:1450 stop:2727 length:1278 start_codon:yes stop_codon:yes gene_type:complete
MILKNHPCKYATRPPSTKNALFLSFTHVSLLQKKSIWKYITMKHHLSIKDLESETPRAKKTDNDTTLNDTLVVEMKKAKHDFESSKTFEAKAEARRKAHEIVDKARASGKLDAYIGSIYIQIIGQLGEMKEATDIFNEFQQRNQVEHVLISVYMNTAFNLRNYTEVRRAFLFAKKNIEYSEAIYRIYLSATFYHGSFEDTLNGMPVTPIVCPTIKSLFLKAVHREIQSAMQENDSTRAEKAFIIADDKNLLSADIFNSYIQALFQMKEYAKAVVIFNRAHESKTANLNTYSTYMISAANAHCNAEVSRVEKIIFAQRLQFESIISQAFREVTAIRKNHTTDRGKISTNDRFFKQEPDENKTKTSNQQKTTPEIVFDLKKLTALHVDGIFIPHQKYGNAFTPYINSKIPKTEDVHAEVISSSQFSK